MKKTIISIFCFLTIIQFSVAQSNDRKDRNKALYRELTQLANDGKLAESSNYYAESHEIKGIGKGPKAYEVYALGFRKTFPDLNVRIIELIAEGDLVMARCEATGTQKGEMNGTPATGKLSK